MYTKEDYSVIQSAIKFLHQSYKNVIDDTKPELLHSLNVGFRLMGHRYPTHVVIAGFLHDILEEGEGGGQVKELFGEKVFKIIEANTKNKSISGWEAQYADLLPRVGEAGEDALTVKAADILDNIFYRFDINDELGKSKVTLLAQLLFKETDSQDKVFGELRAVYDGLVKSGKIQEK